MNTSRPVIDRHRLNRLHAWQVALCIWIGSATSALADGRLVQYSGPTMGTTYHVKAVVTNETPDLQKQIDLQLAEINALMSTYVADSDVSRFNRSPPNKWFAVSPQTLQVVELSQRISLETDGAFDITVGPLVRLWNFGAGDPSGEFTPPEEDEISAALRKIGFAKLETRRNPPALRKTVDGLEIDLSAIAKGYAVDQVAELLLQSSVENFMVEIGGEVRVAGSRPDGLGWRIGIESPDIAERRVETVLNLHDQAIASSGDYRNFFEHEGVRYSHILDATTGRPVEHELASISVLADNCATADAYATALLVLGAEEGKVWAEQHEVPALFIEKLEGAFSLKHTRQWPEVVSAAKDRSSENVFLSVLPAAAIVFIIALFAMSIGVLFGNRRIQGSCGGLAGLKDERGNSLCDACTNPAVNCQEIATSTECQPIGGSSMGTNELK